MDAARKGSEDMGLCMNVKKTKTMVISKEETHSVDILVNNETLEQINSFTYLGQDITPDARNDTEIKKKKRIVLAKSRFGKMEKLFTSKQLTTALRLRMLECYVFSVLTYGCETWTLSKPLIDRLEACEMWFLRKMGRISYKQRKTNEEVLALFETERKLINKIKNRKMSFFGHVKRHDSIIKQIVEGKMNGKRGRGRPRATWADNIKQWTNSSIKDCTKMAKDRGLWRTVSRQPLSRDVT